MLPLLDWDVIRANPKYFSGYSDVTALHTALNQVCGLVTYHTMMPATEYYEDVGEYSMDWLKRALFGGLQGAGEPGGTAPDHSGPRPGPGPPVRRQPVSAGRLPGHPLGDRHPGKAPVPGGRDEHTYRVDGMLTQLRNAGKFDQCAGVILGAWTNCTPQVEEHNLELPEIFRELIAPAGKPAVMGLACGHVIPTLSLPLGAQAALDAGEGVLEVPDDPR